MNIWGGKHISEKNEIYEADIYLFNQDSKYSTKLTFLDIQDIDDNFVFELFQCMEVTESLNP